MIPGIFASYLRDDRPGLLPLVFHHNLQDIVAMLGLMGSLALLARSAGSGLPVQMHADEDR